MRRGARDVNNASAQVGIREKRGGMAGSVQRKGFDVNGACY
jgi:hypothetical protein